MGDVFSGSVLGLQGGVLLLGVVRFGGCWRFGGGGGGRWGWVFLGWLLRTGLVGLALGGDGAPGGAGVALGGGGVWRLGGTL